MGTGLDRLSARQRPNLTDTKLREVSGDEAVATDPAVRLVVLALLAVDGVLSALAGALLLPLYIGSIPFPVSALISGLVNAALVWAAGRWTMSSRGAAVPLWTWLLTVAVFSLGGPGDDIVFGGQGVMAYGALILIVLGAGPAAWVLVRGKGRR